MSDCDHPYSRIVCDGTLDRLESGELLPREGDFVGSKLNPFICGFVKSIGKIGRKGHEIAAFQVQCHPLGTYGIQTILENDIRFLAPREVE